MNNDKPLYIFVAVAFLLFILYSLLSKETKQVLTGWLKPNDGKSKVSLNTRDIITRLCKGVSGVFVISFGIIVWLCIVGNPYHEYLLLTKSKKTMAYITHIDEDNKFSYHYAFHAWNFGKIEGNGVASEQKPKIGKVTVEYLPSDPTINRIIDFGVSCSSLTDFWLRKILLAGGLIVGFVGVIGTWLIYGALRKKQSTATFWQNVEKRAKNILNAMKTTKYNLYSLLSKVNFRAKRGTLISIGLIIGLLWLTNPSFNDFKNHYPSARGLVKIDGQFYVDKTGNACRISISKISNVFIWSKYEVKTLYLEGSPVTFRYIGILSNFFNTDSILVK